MTPEIVFMLFLAFGGGTLFGIFIASGIKAEFHKALIKAIKQNDHMNDADWWKDPPNPCDDEE